MFENIFKGFSFIKESFSLIMKDADVIKPSFYSIFAGAFFTILSVIIMFLLQSGLGSGIFFYIFALLLFHRNDNISCV